MVINSVTSNFEFIRAEWPVLFDECARAERYVRVDPRVACIYARRALEQAVTYVYDVARLPIPYKDDLSAKINAAELRNLTGHGIATKMNLVRKLGNAGAHDSRTIPPDAAMQVVQEVHHIVYWTARQRISPRSNKDVLVGSDPLRELDQRAPDRERNHGGRPTLRVSIHRPCAPPGRT